MHLEKIIMDFILSQQIFFEQFGILTVFITVACESLPILGFVIPGQTILILAGIFARLGTFPFWQLFVIAAIGSFIGDVVAYWLGKKYSKPILHQISRFISKEKIEKTQTLTERHLGKAIFFGRFNSLTRSLSPFFAGVSDVKALRFIGLAFISGIVWSFTFSILGFVLGEGFQIILPAMGKFLVIATAITIFIIYIGELAKKRGLKFSSKQIWLFVTSIISIYAFAIVAQNVTDHSAFSIIDQQVAEFVASFRNSIALWTMWWLGFIGPKTFFLIALIPTFILYRSKRYKDLTFFGVTLLLSSLSVILLKIFFSRPRPLFHFIFKETSSSFPSGHAVLATIFLALICYEAKNYMKKWQLILLYAFSGVLIFLVGFSRLYFGVHWASDVIGGFCFGIFFFSTSLLSFELLEQLYKRIKQKKII
ncbi:MAG: bifunctional DedA family/phosphatase PAP2 family protein [Candidatus Paceibacterota bacterium]